MLKDPEPDLTIVVGDQVRSFDFDYCEDLTGDRACYVEGEVAAIGPIEGCDRYLIRVSRRVFGGEEVEHPEWVRPPVNGTRQLFSNRPTAGVFRFEKGN